MPSPPTAASRLVWILALPVHTPVSSTWLRCRPRHSGASLTPGLSLLSFCRLALGLCVLVFLRASASLLDVL
jgi:hypothetical protein